MGQAEASSEEASNQIGSSEEIREGVTIDNLVQGKGGMEAFFSLLIFNLVEAEKSAIKAPGWRGTSRKAQQAHGTLGSVHFSMLSSL